MKIFPILIVVTILAIIIYGLLRSQSLLGGPIITINSPKPYEEVSQLFTISGSVQHASFLSVNSRRIYPTRTGSFAITLAFPLGYTEVSLFARNKRGKKAQTILPIYIHNNDKEKSDERSTEEKDNSSTKKN